MKKSYLYLFFFGASIALLYSSLSVFGRSSGTGIAGNTNAPSEGSCAGCHTGTALQTSAASTTNLLHNTGFLGGGYFPDTTYNMTIAFKKTGTSKFGFSLTVLKESDDSPVGSLTAVTGSSQASTAFVGGKTRSYVSHTGSSNSSTSTDSIYWSFKWKAPNSDVGNVNFYAVVNATNSNNQNSGDVIYAKKFTYGISNLVTTATIESNDTVICANEPVVLKGNGTNIPLAYEWKMPSGNPTSDTSKTSSVTYTTSGIKWVTLRTRNQYGWSKLDSMKVTVKATPIANIINIGPIELCEGDSIELQASFQLNTQYKWLPGNQNGRKLWVKDSGNYRVEATNTLTNCVRLSNAIRVNVSPKPTLTITDIDKADTVCNLFPVRYLIQTSGSYDSAQVFVNGNLNQTGSKDTVSISPPAGDSFIFDVKLYNNGCISDLSNSIVKYTLPTPNVPSANCGAQKDSSITINWNAVPSVSGYEVSKDSGMIWIELGPGVLSHTFSNLQKGVEIKLLLRSVSATACPKSTSAAIVCSTTPCIKPFSSIDWKSNVCVGQEDHLIIRGLTTNNYTVNINGVPQPMDSLVSFELMGDSTLTVSLTDLNQLECGAYEETQSITAQSRINASYGIITNDSICKNDLVVWNIDPKRSSISYEIFVQRDMDSELRLDSFTSSGVYTTPIIADSQRFRLQITEGVCKEEINVPTLFGVDVPVFNTSISASWYYHTLLATDPTLKYVWKDSKGVQIDQNGDSVVYYLIAEKGQGQKIYVTGTNSFGCETLDSVEFTVGDFLSVSQLSKQLNVYPNPNSGKKLYIENNTSTKLQLELHDVSGKLIQSLRVKLGLNAIQLNGVDAGIYLLTDEQGLFIEKLIIE
jgi:hypothetical protein